MRIAANAGSRTPGSEELRGRDGAAVDDVLKRVRAAAQGDENMMPLLIEAVEAYATIGEICDVLREEWGEYEEVLTL